MKQRSSISSFKQFCWKYILPFIVCLIAGLFCIDLLFQKLIISKTESSGTAKVDRIKTNDDPNETPILGSSRAEGSFIPDSLGRNYFNYGMAGVQDDVWLYFLKIELAKKRKTPIIINIDIDGLQSLPSGLIYWLNNANDPVIKGFIGDQWKPIHYIPFLRNFGQFEIHLANYLKEKFEVTGATNKGAIIEMKSLSKKEFIAAIERRNAEKIIVTDNPSIKNELMKVLADTKGRKIIFILPPYHQSYINAIQNVDQVNKLHSQIAAFPNVYLLNYSSLPYPNSYFYNTSHLNKEGAIYFNSILKKDLTPLINAPIE
jgi:hypothetical protein